MQSSLGPEAGFINYRPNSVFLRCSEPILYKVKSTGPDQALTIGTEK